MRFNRRLTLTVRREFVEETRIKALSDRGTNENVSWVTVVHHFRTDFEVTGDHSRIRRLFRFSARFGTYE